MTAPAFSTAAGNELLLAFVSTDSLPGANTTVVSVAGGGLTWALVVRTNVQNGTAEIWRAFASSRLTNASVTATMSRSVVSSLTVMSFSGVDTSGTNGSGAIGAIGRGNGTSGAPTATLVTTRNNSWVFGVGNDFDSAIARTPGTGQSLVHQHMPSIGDTYWVQKQNSPTTLSGTSVTINDTAPTADRYNLSICEILPAQTWTISGTISPTLAGIGATVFMGEGPQATADGSGNYSFIGFPDGTYAVSVYKSGYTFSPSVQLVTINGANVTGLNFTGTSIFSPSVVGEWSLPVEVGMMAANNVLLHTGKVLMFSGSFSPSATERVLDPATGSFRLVPNPYYRLFGSGQSQLPDGRILVVGGFDADAFGASNANVFDPLTETWSALPNMAYRRWSPTSTTLPDGRVLVTSGAQTCATCLADVPEIFDPATGAFTTIPSARLAVPYYPFMFVLPDGKVIDAGATYAPAPTSRLDLTAGTWTTVDPIVMDGHSAAMYQPGKILKSGTAANLGTSGNAASTAYVLDATEPSPAWRQVASMAHTRAFHNTTLLPDGGVLVTGGGTTLDGYDAIWAVLQAELWSPTTERWTTLAAATKPRLYRSAALLLPDGRVLIDGGGTNAGGEQTTVEYFSPPYLFRGPRPTIASAPSVVQYSTGFAVQTPDAASIASVSLIRPGAVNNSFNMDQRLMNLSFTAGADSLTIDAPANANLAPPGYYMLFLVNSAGVPSVAAFVQLVAPDVDRERPSPPTALFGQGAIGSATLTWNSATDNTGVALYSIHRSTTSGFQPSSSNRVGQSTSTSFTNTGVPAGTYFFVVMAEDVVGNVSAPSNEAPVIVLADTSAPTVAMNTPAEMATVSGPISVAATASDDVGVASVQFRLDGQPLGPERTAAPYAMTWDSTTTSNGSHVLAAFARDAANNASEASVNVVVWNTTETPTGLVAAYGFNQGSGVQVTDASGQGNTGTISSATWAPLGKFGQALSFNGTSAWVTVADAASLDLTTGMTIEAWVNPTSGTGWRTVVLKEDSGGLAYSLYSANNGSRPEGYVHTTSDKSVSGTSAVPLNTWTHVAVTYDGATLRMFVNGVQVRSLSATGAAVATSGALRIGGNSVWGEYFRGLIDEVRIYNRALLAGEIQTDMGTPIR